MRYLFLLISYLLLSSCEEASYDYPIGNFECPMGFRLEYCKYEKMMIPNEVQDSEFQFSSKHNHLKKCPRCGTPMKYVKAYISEIHRQMREDGRVDHDDMRDIEHLR